MADGEVFFRSGAVMKLLETVCWILCPPCWCLQAVHCLQGEKPVLAASMEGAFGEDLTTKSLMLVGRRKATIGGSGMASLQRLDVWRMGRYLWIVLAIVEWVGC